MQSIFQFTTWNGKGDILSETFVFFFLFFFVVFVLAKDHDFYKKSHISEILKQSVLCNKHKTFQISKHFGAKMHYKRERRPNKSKADTLSTCITNFKS